MPPSAGIEKVAALHLTYELYLRRGDGAVVFEPLTCAADSDLLPLVRARMDAHGARSAEVRRLGEPLFTVEA